MKKLTYLLLSFSLIGQLSACQMELNPALESQLKTSLKDTQQVSPPSTQKPVTANSASVPSSFTTPLQLQSGAGSDCESGDASASDNSGGSQTVTAPTLPCPGPLVDDEIDISNDTVADGSITGEADIPHWRENPPDPGFVRGERLAYTSVVSGQEDIFISHIDGSNSIRVTNSPQHERSPVFSPDGHFISYTTNQLQRGWELFETFAQGKLVTRLTFDHLNSRPIEWSSQNELTFTNNGQLYVYSATQNQIRSLIPYQQVKSPVWSTDGETIAYVYQGDIYSVDRLGENNEILVKGPHVTGAIDWSGDDKSIVFESSGRILKHKVDGDFALLQATPTLLGAFVVLSDQGDMDPVFSPDGTEVAFTSVRTGQKEIFVVDSDTGASSRQITHHAGESYHPAW